MSTQRTLFPEPEPLLRQASMLEPDYEQLWWLFGYDDGDVEYNLYTYQYELDCHRALFPLEKDFDDDA